MTRDQLAAAVADGNVAAFLRVIRAGESSQEDDAYTVMFGGGHFAAPPWEHPATTVSEHGLASTAAGAYQFIVRTWRGLVEKYGFENFSPANQDQGAVALIAGRAALDDVIAGRIEDAIRKCAMEWASLPGSPYGQPTRTLEQALSTYRQYGGQFAQDAAPQPLEQSDPAPTKGGFMAPLLLPILEALGPSLVQMIPQLGQLFGSGSDVQKRNVAALSMVADAVVKATDSPNVQAAVEKMQDDPGALAAAKGAIDDIWPAIAEAGGGGIREARKAVVDAAAVPLRHQAPFVMALLFFGLIAFVVVASMLKVSWIADVTPETRAGVIMFVLGTIGGGIVGFYYGTTQGSQRKTDLMAK